MSNQITDILHPMNSLQLFGFNKEFGKFLHIYDKNKLPKVILLTGDKGIGKFTFIFHFINYIISANSEYPYNKKNFLINSENFGYKRLISNTEQNFNYIGSLNPGAASIEDIRNIKKSYYKSSLNNLSRFTILDDVELLNINAANALLKLIEEPSSYDYFILINNKKRDMISTLKSRSLEFKLFLNKNYKSKILDFLKKKFNIKKNFLDKYLDTTNPGSLIRFYYLLDQLKVNENEDHLLIIKKIINDYKKNKYQINLDLAIFLIDIKFSYLSKSNNNTLELLDVKKEITKLFFQYRNFNLNTDAVINKLERYSNYVR